MTDWGEDGKLELFGAGCFSEWPKLPRAVLPPG